ncbi:MAG TPA: S53 family peptidase, partial [Micromonosporaceae bacterium]|nr:S53 family peptidase [Micromonosporaceae bacterium]
GSQLYGQNWTTAQFAARFAPTAQTVEQVRAWLARSGLRVGEVSSNGHFVAATGSVRQLEAAFHTTLGIYRHPSGARLTAPASAVEVPRRLRASVTAVVGLDDSGRLVRPAHDLSRLRPAAQAAQDGQFCARFWAEFNNAAVPQKYPAGSQSNVMCGYTAPVVRGIYGQTNANTGAGQQVAITGSYNLTSAEADTNRWATQSGASPLQAGQYQVVAPPGGYRDNPNCDGPAAWAAEQAMDLQAVHTMASAAMVTWYAGADCTDNYNALNRAVAENKASIISNSWGAPGENIVPAAVRDQVGAILVQAAIQGQSVLFASGDTGDTTGTAGRGTPQFPASHPWATAVGGTSVAVGSDNRIVFATGWETSGNTLVNGAWQPQQDADGPFAGGATGGRSSIYAAPSYQRGVVPDSYAQGKRTVPDISALADPYTGMVIGVSTSSGFYFGPGGGTSLASPLLAGMLANAQQAKGGNRLGFLNGALYALRTNSSAIVDMTPHAAGMWTSAMGSFGGVSTPTEPGDYLLDLDAKPQSLQSGPGWDPVTGVGTPGTGFVSAIARR